MPKTGTGVAAAAANVPTAFTGLLSSRRRLYTLLILQHASVPENNSADGVVKSFERKSRSERFSVPNHAGVFVPGRQRADIKQK